VRALALLYHDVVDGDDWDATGFPGPAPASYKLERRNFERHIAAVSTAAARRGTVSDLLRGGDGQPPVLLTFDDGGASSYSCIAGLLERSGWRGHFFITTDYLDHPGFVTRGQVRELAARGHVIGTHSCSHPLRMSSSRWDRLVEEWTRSVAVLSDVLAAPVEIGSVPGGAYSRRVAAAAAAAGITALFTSEPIARCRSVEGCLVIGRYSLRRATPARTAGALASGRPFPRLGQWCFWNCKKAAKAVGGDAYVALRRWVYGGAPAGGPRPPAARGLPDRGAPAPERPEPGVQPGRAARDQVRR
jgi:peptidoglycan/xylan/chitin deacetylase (PgdA/CDA1 family)